MIFLFSSNVLKQHDKRLDGILKTSYLLIMISLSLCKPKTISLLVKLNQLKEKKLSLRLGFTTGLESIFVYLETNLSCLLYVIHFFPPKEDFHFRETLPFILSLSDADRWKIIGSSWFPREDFSRVCSAAGGRSLNVLRFSTDTGTPDRHEIFMARAPGYSHDEKNTFAADSICQRVVNYVIIRSSKILKASMSSITHKYSSPVVV